ncbi:nucleobase:cation symporter-1, NCS1 family [Faunimonas pinastri]|uniref:Nucleobase:cation symporter-1, NCS1 family n=1 Tax=Faunimonas pinastri TaxID=1855383 RepID=A0A1H9PKF5_9HYPH|nr:cytosine permease [Faunimonas pinastri]SER48756.1 nucleobase:cation symporter-1, NCS1 family [Faunimonas pinastri]
MSEISSTGIEENTIYPIPLDQRHGKARDLFTIWFGSNIMMLTIVTGALATTVFGLGLTHSIVALIIGNFVGAIFMALHAAQGPQLGVPQMVQTRGQFGSFGAVAVVALVVIMYVGFFASNLVLGGQSLHSIVGFLSQNTCVVVVALVSVVAAIFGHDLIHSYAKLLTWLSGLALVATFGWLFLVHGVPAEAFTKGVFTVAGFLGAVSTAALWQIAYAPYVSDYSRYMPPKTGSRQAFWASYFGCVLGSLFPMFLGAILGTLAVGGDVVAALTAVLGPLALIVIPIFSLGIAATNAMNLYCGVLSSLTVIQTFVPGWKVRPRARVVAAIVLAGLSLVIAIFSAADFMAQYTNFILLLLYVLVPWTAINLVDFYLVRHGEYDVASFFRRDGGVYGRYCWPALFCYALGIVIQIPFISNGIYTGPVATMLNGADISWIVGLAVVSPIYWAIMKYSLSGAKPATAGLNQVAR